MGFRSTFKRLYAPRLNNTIFFIAGLLISTGFELVFRDFTKDYPFIVTLLAGIMVAAVVYSNVLNEKTLNTAIENIGTVVRYVEEEWNPARTDSYRGVVYKELESIVSNAKEEILQIGVFHEEEYHTSNHKSRAAYFKTLEERIARAENAGEQFVYTRLHQFPESLKNEPMKNLLHDRSLEHFKHMVSWTPTSGDSKVYIHMARIQRRMMMPFRVIDKSTVILEIDAIASDGKPYAAGIIIIDDRGGRIAERFRHYFIMLENRSTAVELADLT
jgi:hypothetical protein